MRGHSDNRAGADQGPDRGRRQIVLTDVHAGRTGEPGDVAAIVDDDLCALGTGHDGGGLEQEVPG
jgi:hypothetical protein